MAEQTSLVRPPAWAGMFYPRESERLEKMIKRLVAGAPEVEIDGKVMGLIVPHAGYEYSGPTAASGYKLIQGRTYDAVILLAPSHHEFIRGISIFNGSAYSTPLGPVAVDQELSRALASQDERIILSDLGHRTIGQNSEHSLEVQLPFLQVLLGQELKIVAAVFHSQDFDLCQKLGTAIARVIRKKNILIIASSDLYHGYSYEELQTTDNLTLATIESGDAQVLCQGLESGMYMACGGGPIAALLLALEQQQQIQARVIARANSADITGSRGGWTVGYAAIAVYRPGN